MTPDIDWAYTSNFARFRIYRNSTGKLPSMPNPFLQSSCPPFMDSSHYSQLALRKSAFSPWRRTGRQLIPVEKEFADHEALQPLKSPIPIEIHASKILGCCMTSKCLFSHKSKPFCSSAFQGKPIDEWVKSSASNSNTKGYRILPFSPAVRAVEDLPTFKLT